jgi:hypothetical protein
MWGTRATFGMQRTQGDTTCTRGASKMQTQNCTGVYALEREGRREGMADTQKRMSDEELVAIRLRAQLYHGRSERQLREDALALLSEVDRLRAIGDSLTHLSGVVAKGKGMDTERATLIAFVDRVMQDGWYERQDSNGDVWCKGCGVQLSSLRDNFASTHRSGCPVLKVIALVARKTPAGEQGH